MKKHVSLFLFIFLSAAFLAGSINAQGKYGVVGKKFKKQEADALFGKVITSVKVNKVALQYAVGRAGDYIYFKVKNNRAFVLNDKRVSILNETDSFNPKERLSSVTSGIPALPANEVVYALSKSTVAEFLNSSTSDVITIENRAEVLSISDGEIVLEKSVPCPPWCE